MYQSGRAGDEAKKRKSPAKSGRVGITVTVVNNVMIMIVMMMITLHCPMSRTLFTNIPTFSTLQNDIEMFLKTFQ